MKKLPNIEESQRGRGSKPGPLREEHLILCKALGDQVKAERKRRGITLEKVQEESGVSASTVSRLENHGKPLDAHNEIRIKRWLGLPITLGTLSGTGDTLADIRSAIDADPTLDRKAATALYELMASAYRQLASKK